MTRPTYYGIVTAALPTPIISRDHVNLGSNKKNSVEKMYCFFLNSQTRSNLVLLLLQN